MTPEEIYITKIPGDHRKKYAQFFTPEPIARFMCDWVLKGKNNAHVLEPAYGLGIFSRIISPDVISRTDAYELDPTILKFASSVLPEKVTIHNEDYLKTEWDSTYDAIICNPPYLKFHDYDNGMYIPAINNQLNLKLSGSTNIYTLFLLKSLAQLNPGGRLAYIIPSEFMNADYGTEVKRALLHSKNLKHVIVVDFKESAFSDALTTACILLCEKSNSETVRFSAINNINDLESTLECFSEFNISDLNPEKKWKAYYEKSNAGDFSNLVPFSKFARVSRGIATGANSFFTFSLANADRFDIPMEALLPCVCKAVDVSDTIFTQDSFNRLANRGKAAFIFDAERAIGNPSIVSYLKLGVNAGIHKRYLTAKRNPWYTLENRPPAPIWVSVFNRSGLRFIRNEVNALNLTCFHCVYPNNTVDTDILFAYLLTDVAKQIFLDNSRQYANGLIKFEPNDLNKGLVMDLSLLSSEENKFIKNIYSALRPSSNLKPFIDLLNSFFIEKFSNGKDAMPSLLAELKSLASNAPINKVKAPQKQTPHSQQLSLKFCG